MHTVDCERCGKTLNADTELWETADELVCQRCYTILIVDEALSLLNIAAVGYKERAALLLMQLSEDFKADSSR